MRPAALDPFPEIIAVLGGGLEPDGRAAPPTLRRAERAAGLARERHRSAVVLLGSHGIGQGAPFATRTETDAPRPARTEARLMGEALRRARIPTERIFYDEESRDTIGNAALLRLRFLEGIATRPLTLVTSPFHADRVRWIFERVLGPEWPFDIAESREAAGDEERAANETRYRVETEATLAGLAPGDLGGVIARLATRWPYYRELFAER